MYNCCLGMWNINDENITIYFLPLGWPDLRPNTDGDTYSIGLDNRDFDFGCNGPLSDSPRCQGSPWATTHTMATLDRRFENREQVLCMRCLCRSRDRDIPAPSLLRFLWTIWHRSACLLYFYASGALGSMAIVRTVTSYFFHQPTHSKSSRVDTTQLCTPARRLPDRRPPRVYHRVFISAR